jgi:UDP-galactopyranose mutase
MKPRTFANLVRLSFRRPPAASSASANKSRYECRRQLAGNCHTERDARSQIMLHVYGPHIFHTDDEKVWTYVNRYMEFKPYVNRG